MAEIKNTGRSQSWRHKHPILFVVLVAIIIVFAYNYFTRHPSDYYSEENIQMRILEEDGYEVLYFEHLGTLIDSEHDSGYVKMKSLGNRDEQFFSGLFAITQAYSNASWYSVRILEPTRDCWYMFSSQDYRDLREMNLMFSLESIEAGLKELGREYRLESCS